MFAPFSLNENGACAMMAVYEWRPRLRSAPAWQSICLHTRKSAGCLHSCQQPRRSSTGLSSSIPACSATADSGKTHSTQIRSAPVRSSPSGSGPSGPAPPSRGSSRLSSQPAAAHPWADGRTANGSAGRTKPRCARQTCMGGALRTSSHPAASADPIDPAVPTAPAVPAANRPLSPPGSEQAFPSRPIFLAGCAAKAVAASRPHPGCPCDSEGCRNACRRGRHPMRHRQNAPSSPRFQADIALTRDLYRPMDQEHHRKRSP